MLENEQKHNTEMDLAKHLFGSSIDSTAGNRDEIAEAQAVGMGCVGLTCGWEPWLQTERL